MNARITSLARTWSSLQFSVLQQHKKIRRVLRVVETTNPLSTLKLLRGNEDAYGLARGGHLNWPILSLFQYEISLMTSHISTKECVIIGWWPIVQVEPVRA